MNTVHPDGYDVDERMNFFVGLDKTNIQNVVQDCHRVHTVYDSRRCASCISCCQLKARTVETRRKEEGNREILVSGAGCVSIVAEQSVVQFPFPIHS